MPLVDLGNPAGSDGLAQLAGPFGSNLGGGTFPRSYEFAKKFVNADKTTMSLGTNGVTSLDDPTYLGFTLMFDISSPLFNGATSGYAVAPGPQTFEGFQDSLIARDGPSPLTEAESAQNNYPSTESAVAYLNKIGEANRVGYLKAFIQGIQEINQTRPYYFQTIQGLQSCWERNSSFSIDPYQGTKEGEGITIGCLEAIDLKITALFSLYKMAVYDSVYKRFIVPKNLLHFNVYVYTQEIRKFQTVRNWLGAANPNQPDKGLKEFINENTSQVGFQFIDCIWDPAACGKVFEGVTNTGGNIATTEIKWGYDRMENISQFSGYNSKLKDGLQASTDPSFFGKVKQFGKDAIMGQVDGAIQAAGRAASSLVGGFTLGNVFGARADLLGAISNPQALSNALAGAVIGGNDGIDIGQGGIGISTELSGKVFGQPDPPDILKKFNNLDPATPPNSTLGASDNVFGPSGPPLTSTIDDGSIFPPAPPVGEGLESTNIFDE